MTMRSFALQNSFLYNIARYIKGERDMEYTISNNKLKLTIDSHGAEIRSLIRISDSKELMWQADSTYWGRTSPVLFPLVGNYYGKQSIYKGKTYEMGQHGFARDMEFSLVSQSDKDMYFKLMSDESTLQKYPFAFTLIIGYILEDDRVVVSWRVDNTNDETMYFSIGAHPAFNCDLDTYTLRFTKGDEALDSIVSNVIDDGGSGCLSDNQDTYKLDKGILRMSDELFAKDALIIEDSQADRVTIVDDNGQDMVAVTCPSSLFGVWSPTMKHAPFVCIEPWYGRCDRVGFNQHLEEREHSNSLLAGQSFEASYEIIVC